jgi:hypothetical protein
MLPSALSNKASFAITGNAMHQHWLPFATSTDPQENLAPHWEHALIGFQSLTWNAVCLKNQMHQLGANASKTSYFDVKSDAVHRSMSIDWHIYNDLNNFQKPGAENNRHSL